MLLPAGSGGKQQQQHVSSPARAAVAPMLEAELSTCSFRCPHGTKLVASNPSAGWFSRQCPVPGRQARNTRRLHAHPGRCLLVACRQLVVSSLRERIKAFLPSHFGKTACRLRRSQVLVLLGVSSPQGCAKPAWGVRRLHRSANLPCDWKNRFQDVKSSL